MFHLEEEKNRMNHEINLTGYTATCGETNNMLDLGTAGSYGLEKLHVTADAAWNGLTITATFTNSGSTTVPVTDGAVDVPPEATRLPTRDRMRYGMLAFKGVDAQGKLRIISTPIDYRVQDSAETDGSNTINPTPDQYAQFVAEVMAEADRAEAAADRAESAGGNVTPEQIAEAVNNYLNENPVQATPIDTTLSKIGQAADAKAVGDAIADIELTPGPAGANGTDGKSAYQYAVEGGYTGTEEEFAAGVLFTTQRVDNQWEILQETDFDSTINVIEITENIDNIKEILVYGQNTDTANFNAGWIVHQLTDESGKNRSFYAKNCVINASKFFVSRLVFDVGYCSYATIAVNVGTEISDAGSQTLYCSNIHTSGIVKNISKYVFRTANYPAAMHVRVYCKR